MTTTAQQTVLELAVLVGRWENTNRAGSIERITCRPAGDSALFVSAISRATGGERDWGKVIAPVFSFTFDSHDAGAFNARFDLGFAIVHMQANVKAGVLVVATFTRFTDGSGRAAFFDREFFHRVAP